VTGRMRLAATGLVIVIVAALALNRNFYNQSAADLFFSITLACTSIVFFYVRPLAEALHVLVVATLLVVLQLTALRMPPRIAPALALWGVSSLALLGWRRICSGDAEDRRLLHYAFLPPLLLVLLGYVGSVWLAITDRLHPKTFDMFLYNFDASMGMQPSFKAGQFVLPARWLTRIALLFYFALPVPVMLVYAQQLVRRRSTALIVFLGFFIAGPVAVVFYNLLPACGPIYLFGSRFPFAPLTTLQAKEMPVQPVLVSGLRNAFPSLHLAWAVLACWYAAGLSRWTKLFLLIFLAGTTLATLGLGEHYFIDLIAAFPFALMIRAGCALHTPRRDRRRLMPLLSGTLLLLGWVALLRFGLKIVWVSKLVPWTLVGCTIVSCLALNMKLQRAHPDRV
jgi:hypothetical protein